MTRAANPARPNPARGEAIICGHVLRPSFERLVVAEEELGSLFALVERAASGNLSLKELAGLFWHCLDDQPGQDRAEFSERVMQGGLVAATPALKTLIGQILGGVQR